MTANSEVKMLSLSYKKLKELVCKYGEVQSNQIVEMTKKEQKLRIQKFATRVLIAQNRYLKAEMQYPVDYIKIEPNQRNITQTLKDKVLLKKYRRRNILKNVVMRIIVENRERNSRPKLTDVLDVYRNRLNESKNVDVKQLKA